MKTIINQSISDMLNKLLDKALEEKPDYADEYTINYCYLNLKIETYNVLIHLVKNDFNCSGCWLHYPFKLTDEQKNMIEQIFQKWGNNNANNN